MISKYLFPSVPKRPQSTPVNRVEIKCHQNDNRLDNDSRSSFAVNLSLSINHQDPTYKHGLTLIPARISNNTHYIDWDEITYSLPNFNGCTTVEV